MGLALVPTLDRFFSLTPARASGNEKVTYIHFKLHGGYSFVSDFQGLDGNGNALPNAAYTSHGAPKTHGTSNNWGAPVWVGQSSIPGRSGTPLSLQRLLASVPTTVKFATYAAKHNDDISSWVDPLQFIASYMNQRYNASFKTVSNLTYGGSNLKPVDGFAPVVIDDEQAWIDLMNPKVGPLASLNPAQLGALAGLSQSLTNRFLARVTASQAQGHDTLTAGLRSGYDSVVKGINANVSATRPTTDSRLTTYFTAPPGMSGLTAGQKSLMSLLRLVLDQNSQAIAFDVPGLPGTLPEAFKDTFGAYDLHLLGGAALYAGAAFDSGMHFYQAYLIPTLRVLVNEGFSFYIDITTDGSIGYTGTLEEGGSPLFEAQKYSMVVSAAYRAGASASPFSRYQVGAYAADGSVDVNAHLVSASEMNTALLRAANALKFFGFDPAQDSLLRSIASQAITTSPT